ncbi:MAG: hypothetical protein ABI685_04960 [Ferruginibacter sp.]
MWNIMYTVTDTMHIKLQRLVSFLSQVTRGFDTIAEEIDCANLKTAMLALSVETKQYAKEISGQLQQFNVTAPFIISDELWDRIETDIHEQASFSKGGEIIALCNNCELYFKKFYEDILQEYFPLSNFKDIITYQLFASQYAFMKIRLLNAMRFNVT